MNDLELAIKNWAEIRKELAQADAAYKSASLALAELKDKARRAREELEGILDGLIEQAAK